jgi:hypothetical protein
VLRLELVLADRPDPGRPLLEIEVLRDDGPDVSAPVDEIGDDGGGDSTYWLVRVRWGISKSNSIYMPRADGWMNDKHVPPSISSVSALYLT